MAPSLKIIFNGIPPSKKNSKRIISRGGRTFLISSESHEAWWHENIYQLKLVKLKFDTVDIIKMVFYAKDRRPHDKTNVAESIMDILKDSGIIPDDNWFIVNKLNLEFGGIDKENPRVEVTLK